MAYNAALGKVELEPHPLFPVCYEWPATRLLRASAPASSLRRARACAARPASARNRGPGATRRREGRSGRAEKNRACSWCSALPLTTNGLVSTTDFSALYRDVKLDGAERNVAAVEDPPRHARSGTNRRCSVAATAAHIYTECARIWNPIHTDRAYARAAGLPDIILHGTATLALSVSKLVDVLKPEVRRVRCRFAGMVLMPSSRCTRRGRRRHRVRDARDARGETVIDRGWIS